jgi:large subunit ribosomal protein L31
MKDKIHPNYVDATVHCACGNSFQTRATKPDLHVDICSNCHPFFTGQQRIVDTAGRVERFTKRLEKSTKAKEKSGAKK